MEFNLTDEQRAIQDVAQRFAVERLAPGYLARDAGGAMDRDIVRELGALGLIAPELPENFGGTGVDSVTAGVIIEAISHGDMNIAYVPLLTGLVGAILVEHADFDLARRVVSDARAGEMLLALALTEPNGGSDAANLQLRASRTNKGYILNGEKTSISIADQADQALVFARSGKPEDRARGVSAFLIDCATPGLSRTAYNDLGSRIVGRGSLFFDNVRVEDSARIGAEGAGFYQVMDGFDYSRALIGLMVLGAARASLEESWKYVQEREAFGKPIAAYQGVTFPLAEAETMLEAARLLSYKTLWLRDRGLPHTAEAAMVKWWAPKVAFDVIHHCLLAHGHLGYGKDTPHQQRLRDVLGLQIGDGTAQIQKMVIARERIGRIALGRD
ncbi:MAG: cyclohexanecarboxyl-CoA dehydrogenase [Rhodospirillaceae bacterium]|nr:cyclohexanecarboxyl-CoA dehydrogenase [Rhodospirillaceae bacterium]